MPSLTRWYIKTALVFLALALFSGLMMAAQRLWHIPIPIGGSLPVYIHLLVVGWVTEFIIGVVYWMFPKYTREKPRGSESLGWVSYVLLNTGLLLRVISEPLIDLNPALLWGWMLVVSAGLQWMGGMAFVVNTWGRVKEK
jgi:hypothetical protein